ncbi:amino acid transporter [Microbacterium caowuchunii]|uniref:amino acid transporter n=1 Tax=Microbacterium caowuchunii TaxID=2614638 RepID=UPI001247373E|nr:amino acid transporter [Microbacterium caowuchunii]QEW01299.1 amino acid transporter [Microbacterium caowuchunii]
MTDKPTRRDLMKPVQLLGLAFVAALFAGVVTLVSMGFFQNGDKSGNALMIGGIVAGITFIVVLVVTALLILAVDPADVTKTLDRPVLLPKEESAGDAASDPDATPGSTPPTR